MTGPSCYICLSPGASPDASGVPVCTRCSPPRIDAPKKKTISDIEWDAIVLKDEETKRLATRAHVMTAVQEESVPWYVCNDCSKHNSHSDVPLTEQCQLCSRAFGTHDAVFPHAYGSCPGFRFTKKPTHQQPAKIISAITGSNIGVGFPFQDFGDIAMDFFKP